MSLKAELANRPKSPTPKFPNQPDKDREALLRSLQERIISLERQLQAGADTGGCTSCTEDRRISRSKFLQLVFQFS